MEAANGSINSKVIVQFNDPNDLYKDVAPQIQKRLPLGNLHWKSPSRPLRSIEELDVSLDRLQDNQGQSAIGNNVRRHQIPGLRQTPFVKVLLVRCDDKENYKESARKDTKDWVKSLGFSTSGKNITKGQERHDAYEYIIVHVVLPGTPAANQPRSSKHFSVDATDSTDSVNSKSKWTGKSTSTVFDKLKADFASSSKAPFERVAQVRLTDPSKPSNALGPLEIEEQWQDLLDKLKVAILQSFDARVAQYEEDIKERDSQRSLPGWNFCTFFILKEGLARGFENVGLLEDALQVYDELDAGLDVIVEDQASQDQADAANALLPYATDLKDIIRTVLDADSLNEQPNDPDIILNLQAWADTESAVSLLRLDRRPYQQMILTNQISALDFRTYIFICQTQIMLRRAGTSTSTPKSKTAKRNSTPRWDADLLTIVCSRSVSFINLAARNLRQDLFAAWGGHDGLPEHESNIQQIAIDNIVASRKWAFLLQTILECQILVPFATLQNISDTSSSESSLFSPKDLVTNYAGHGSSPSVSTTTSNDTNGPMTTNGDLFTPLRIVRGSKSDLLFCAAELFMMLRTILLQQCKRANMLKHLTRGVFSNTESHNAKEHHHIGVDAPSLKSCTLNEANACKAYKLLTVCACQCYTSAGKTRSSRQLLFDLANVEAENDKLELALGWLDAIQGFLDTPPRTKVEHSMINLYIDCLRKTERQADLMQALLLMLESKVMTNQTDTDAVQKLWNEIMTIAAKIPPTNTLFSQLFSVDQIDTHVDSTGVYGEICISLCLATFVALPSFGKGSVQLLCQAREQQLPPTVTFSYDGELVMTEGQTRLNLSTSVMTEGWYDVLQLTVRFGNLTFTRDFSSGTITDVEDQQVHTREPKLAIYLYQRTGVPVVKGIHSPLVNLATKRNIVLTIDWGQMDVTKAEMRLKPATAGARLDVLATKSLSDTVFDLSRQDDSHRYIFENMPQSAESKLEIPYGMDDPASTNMMLRVELSCEIAGVQKTVRVHDLLSIMILLPISVNVQDIFQKSITLSRFTVGPSRLVPVSVIQCSVDRPQNLDIEEPAPWNDPIDVFPKQPLSWTVKVGKSLSKIRPKLQLNIDYHCVDEAILETITRRLVADLSRTEFLDLVKPLVAHLHKKAAGLWTEQGTETSTILAEIDLWTFDQLEWREFLRFMRKPQRIELQRWLENWHSKASRIPLEIAAAPLRTLQLIVDYPSSQLVVSTRLDLHSDQFIVGQPILATLQGHIDFRDGSLQPSLQIEIMSQADTWLVGGQKRLSIGPDVDSFSSSVVLVAEKTGKLLLPGVEVHCLDIKSNKAVECEIDNASASITVEVKSDIRSTIVALGDGEISEGHWLTAVRKGQD